MRLTSFTAIVLFTSLVILGPANAANFQELEWDDLVPAKAQFDDIFTKLDEDQLDEITIVAEILDQMDAGQKIEDEELALYRRTRKSLEEQDIDIDNLLSLREVVTQERIAKTFLANQDLDGKQVRMPGYLLPLEYDGKQVTEFLLVPYVGACIHTPPPPPNQIVYVRSEEGFETDGGLFTPVWVSGVMKTNQSRSNLSLVDGSSDIPSSYTIEASTVKIFE